MAQYAIISLGGKQYLVREGEKLLVDRVADQEGKTFQPDVLFVGGNGEGEIAPKTTVTAKVVGHVRGPKVRIGKYRPKKGYKRHTGFRAALTQIEITTIGGRKSEAATSGPKTKGEPEQPPAAQAKPAQKGMPKGYAEMTVTQITEGSKGWTRPMLEAALAYEQDNAKRKGAIAALEHALEAKETH